MERFCGQRLPVILISFLLTAYHWLFISCRLQCKSQAQHIISSNLQPSRLLLCFLPLYFFVHLCSRQAISVFEIFFSCCTLYLECWSLYPLYRISSLNTSFLNLTLHAFTVFLNDIQHYIPSLN